jgi:hypothetical protein
MKAQLTEAGHDALRATAPHHVASVRRHVFDLLDDDQVDAMTGIFAAISAGLES